MLIFVGKPEGKRSHERPKRTWELVLLWIKKSYWEYGMDCTDWEDSALEPS
jgi:hypothetical protein